MKREVGASAGLFALLALLVHTQLPTPENGAPVQRSVGVGASAKKSSESGDRIETIDGPWLATRAFFHAASSSRPLESDLPGLLNDLTSASPEKAPNRAKLGRLLGLPPDIAATQMFSIVATVADPSHTHMALFLDEQTEAIESSVRDGGWDFAEQWLPWVDRFDGNEPDINARRTQRRLQREQEELPGVLVFRPAPGEKENRFPNRVLFVFLVPETVTGGIKGPAFYAAMHLANVLSSGSNKIGLLAPSFSGSFAGLSSLIRAMKPGGTATVTDRISSPVYGGMVSNLQYASLFAEETHLIFHGGILDSSDYQHVLCDVLEKYHMDKMDKRVAELKEDEGGLQRSINITSPTRAANKKLNDKGCSIDVKQYVFPREISHLRNAYQEVSGGAVKDPYLNQPGRVNFSIRDPNSGEDSIPTFSETQTPLTQDTILSSITDELNRQHTHVVFISVTNPLDALFLLQALRAACPDTRVLIEGPNVLFVAAAARQALDGTLFLSPYPMFFEGADWLECTQDKAAGTCQDPHLPPRLMFANSAIQGLYNVTQLLLTDITGADRTKVSLRGYRQPGQPYPGVWVLTLNRFGFLPVDLLGAKISSIPGNQTEKMEDEDKEWFKHNQEKQTALPARLDPLTAPRPWMLTVFMVSLSILLGCFTFVRCNISRQGAKPIWLVFSDCYTSRFEALLCACLSLSALVWILALPWCMPWKTFFTFDSPTLTFLRVSVLLGLASPVVTLLFTLYLLRKRVMIVEIAKAKLRSIIYYVTPILLFGFTVRSWYVLCNRTDTGLFFRFRALELYSGSSPAMPLALACLVFFCISLFHLRQYALAGLARPRLKIEPGVPPTTYQVRFKAAYDSIEQRITAPWTLEKSRLGYRVMVALVFLGFCLLILEDSTSAFELPRYNALLLTAIVAILLCLATKGYDLLNLWGCVNKLLNLIQVLPLGPAIQRIAEDWPKRPVWAFNRSVSKEAVEREMLYRLHRRAVILKNIENEFPKPKMLAAGAAAAGGASEESRINSGDRDSRTNTDVQVHSAVSERSTTSKDAEDHLKRFGELVFGTPGDSPKPRLADILKGNANPAAYAKLDEFAKHQTLCAEVAATIYDTDLRPAWRQSLNDEKDKAPKPPEVDNPASLHHKYVEYCADFVALQFCGFHRLCRRANQAYGHFAFAQFRSAGSAI